MINQKPEEREKSIKMKMEKYKSELDKLKKDIIKLRNDYNHYEWLHELTEKALSKFETLNQ